MNSPSDTWTMAGKACLVTGATSGIGRVTATALAALGAVVIVSGRNRQKAEETVRQIRATTENQSVHFLLADFADLEQVSAMATAVQEQFPRLDVLVNNAGAFFNARHMTSFGVEKTFLVNHLAPFLLTNLLLDKLQAGAPARIVNVSSEGHRQGSMDFDDLAMDGFYFGMRAYGRSKLANILFTYELDRRLGDRGVTVNAVHPGQVATDIWRDSIPLLGPILKRLMELFALSPEEGADTIIYLASAPEVEGVSGRYFIKRKPATSSSASYNEALAQRLWEVSAELTGLE